MAVLLVAALVTLLAAVGVGGAALVVRFARPAPIAATGDGGVALTQAADPRRMNGLVHGGVALAAVLLAATLVLRTIATGHAPWSNLHEFSVAFAAGVLVAYLALERRHPLRALAPGVALLAAALVALSLSIDARVEPLVPALQQPLLLTVHVGLAVASYAVSAVAFVAAIGELAQRRAHDRIVALPSADALRAVAHRSVLVAFPLLTAAIALGAVWANLAWRAPWSNDPKELAAAATWLVYGAYLHVAGRRDRWAALAPGLLVLGFVGVLFTYLGAGLVFVGEHSYAAP